MALALLAVGLGAALAAGIRPPSACLLVAILHGAILGWRPRWVRGLLMLDLGLVGWYGAAHAPVFFDLHFDTWMHLALIRRVVDHGLFPPDPYYRGLAAAPLTSIVHYVYGAAVWATGVPSGDLWRWGTGVAVVGIGAAAYFCYAQILRDPRAALLATVFYLAWRSFQWPHANYPRCVAPAFLHLSLGLLWLALRRQRRWLAAAAGAALGLAFATHPTGGVMAAVVVGAVVGLETIGALRRGSGPRFLRDIVLPLALGALVTAGPWLLTDARAMLQSGATAPALHSEGTLAEFLRTEIRFFVSTWIGIPRWWLGSLWLGSLLVGLAACGTPRVDRHARIYLLATTTVALAAFCPPFSSLPVSLLGARYVARFVDALPLPILAGLGLARALDAAPSGRRIASIFSAGIVAGYVAVLLPTTGPFGLRALPRPALLDRPELARRTAVLADRVVLTDLETAYVLPHFTGAYVTANSQWHSSPWNFDAMRLVGTREILRGRADQASVRSFCEQYEVDYALLGTGTPTSVIDRLLASGAFRRVESGPEFTLLARDDAPAS